MSTHNIWADLLRHESRQPYFSNIIDAINRDVEAGYRIFPEKKNILRSLSFSPSSIKVLILGQEPYHNGHADGLAFSSSPAMKNIPASLKNIFKEIENDLNISNSNKSLTSWAAQGVFLLNSFLSVREGAPLSHASIGWDTFTQKIILKLLDFSTPLVVMLWGKVAQNIWQKATSNRSPSQNVLILESGHPSPFSAQYFFNNRHFSKANHFLEEFGLPRILWET